MSNEEILDIVRRCDLKKGKVLIPDKAYLFNKKYRVTLKATDKIFYDKSEIIVLTQGKVKVGGILRLNWETIWCVMHEEYREQHILSSFLKTGIIREIWPENTGISLASITEQVDYKKVNYLIKLFCEV